MKLVMRACWMACVLCAACGGSTYDKGPATDGGTGAGGKASGSGGRASDAGGGPSPDAGSDARSPDGHPTPACPSVPFAYDGPMKTKVVDGCERIVLELPSHSTDHACYLPFPPGANETVQYDSSYSFGFAQNERLIMFPRRTGDGACNNGMTPDDYGWIPHDCESVELCAYNFCPLFLPDGRVVDVVMPCGWSPPP